MFRQYSAAVTRHESNERRTLLNINRVAGSDNDKRVKSLWKDL